MSAEIINLAEMRPGDPNVRTGNGAREALIEVTLSVPGRSQSDAELCADWILLELAARGFIVTPGDIL